LLKAYPGYSMKLYGMPLFYAEIKRKEIFMGKTELGNADREWLEGIYQKLLVKMKAAEFPGALGGIRVVEAHTCDEALDEQIEQVKKISDIHCMDDLLNSGDTWEVK